MNFHTQKSLAEVIKEKIIARANWTTFKDRVSETDLQIFCEFIKDFSSKDFYEEIAAEYLISAEETKKYVNMFAQNYEQYIQTEIFQDEILENIIKHCPALLEQSRKILDAKYQQDNQEKISAANLELTKAQQRLDEELKSCIDLEDEIKKLNFDVENLNLKLEEINNQIKQRENFAVEVENKIAQRIELARKNVADFICEMAFVNPNFSVVQNSRNNFYRAGKIIDGEEYEIANLEDFIYTLETEIGVEGTHNDNLEPFSKYLTAAYTNRILLLLAGSNARDIADAFSVTLTGKTAAIFDCSNVNSLEDLEVVLNSDDEVICVLNPFAPNFIAYLPELVNIGGKFIFAIYPFAEDLKIEPRSFYNYFLPVFTELIIDRPPTRNFPNRYFLSNELKKELKGKYNPDEVPISAEERIKKLKKVSDTKKTATLFADFPLAYVKGKEEKFIDDFTGDEKVLERIKAFLGKDE